MELEFSLQIFEKCSNTKFHENPSSGADLFHAEGQTDRHTTQLLVAFRNFCESA